MSLQSWGRTVERHPERARENGGQLISERTPAYWGEGAAVGTVQPNMGLDTLFGARESHVEFTADLLESLSLTVRGKQIGGQYFLQEYSLSAGGKAAGRYANGHIAALGASYVRHEGCSRWLE